MADDEGPVALFEHAGMVLEPRLASILLIAFVGPISTSAIAPALPGMASSLGVSDARIGLVITAITLPPMLLSPVVGALGDAYGRRGVALVALFLFGIGGVAIPFVEDFGVILLLRGIQGVGIAGTAPVAVTLIGDLYSGSAATTAQGFRSSSTALSASLVSIVGGWLAGFGWPYPYFIYAFAFVVMAVVFVYVPETAATDGADRPIAERLRASGRLFRSEVTDPDLLVLISGGFIRFFALFTIVTFVPLFAVRSLGATAFEVGIVLGLRGIRIAIAPTAGFWIERFSRKAALLGTAVVILGSIALIPFAPGVAWLAAFVGANAVGDAIFSSVLNDTVTARASDETRNSVVSVMRSLKETGKTAAPVALGVVLTVGGFRWLFLVAAGVVVAYVLAVIAVTGIGEITTPDAGAA